MIHSEDSSVNPGREQGCGSPMKPWTGYVLLLALLYLHRESDSGPSACLHILWPALYLAVTNREGNKYRMYTVLHLLLCDMKLEVTISLTL